MEQMNNLELNNNRKDEELEIDLLELFGHYFDKIWWIVVGFLICALAAGLITHFAITPKYTATAKMYMVSSSSQSVVDLTDLNIGQSISGDYVELLKTRPIIEGVIEDLDLDYWWMDAGWYPCEGNWGKTGTWKVDQSRFPGGFRRRSFGGIVPFGRVDVVVGRGGERSERK